MSDHRFDNFLFRNRVDSCVSKIRLILDSNKAAALGTADMVSHTYEDKYQLANYLTNTAAACSLNCLKAFGMDEARLKMAKQWSQDKDVSLVLHVNESCEYLCEKTREEDSTSKVVVETTFLGKISSKVVNTITEHFYRFKVSYEISLVRGLGVNNEDKISLQSRKASQDICLRAKNMPYLEKNTRSHSVNISWLLRHLDEKLDTMTFSIDRTHKDCHTPARNDDVKTAEKFFHDLDGWVAFVSQYLTNTLIPIQVNHEPNCKIDISQLTSAEVFVPVVPLFNSVPDQPSAAAAVPAIEDGSEQPTSESSSSSETAVVPAATNGQQLIVSASLLNQLLAEESRSLTEKCTQMRTLLPLPTATALTSCAEGAVLVVCTHLKNVIAHYVQGIQFIEHMLRQQLIAAVGKELQPSDFSEYMRFHNRKIFREQYLPAPFTHSVRRSALHSPEGTVRIEESRSGDAIYTVCRSSAASGNVMEFPLNAATKVKFGGERHLHAWLAHSFSGQSVGELKLVAQARQFSSFIVLIGRIAGPTLFEPKHGFIVQNKDEMSIPLWLEQIPTPKEFKDAIESLSPEQKRFAQAFRSMQLESTLFGVCVIQIKPQLEKVLKLSPDSLTKEIQLTQDLMKLFIEYQIPTDLMSFEGAADAGVSERLEKVRGHVAAMNGMLKAAKEAEIEQKNNERLYTYGSADPFIGLPPPPAAAFSGFGAAPGNAAVNSRPRMMMKSAAGGAPPAPPAAAMASMAFASASVSVPVSTTTSVSAGDVLCLSSAKPVVETQQAQQQHQQHQQQQCESSEHSGEDFTQYPTLLDKNYEKHDPDSALRPTIIKVGESWTKKAQAALLTAASTKTLYATDQTAEKTAAFDLLDALSRSGALTIEDASLHVVIAATHCFDKSLMSTVVQKNVNPIERVERSTLIMASTIHGAGAADLVVGSQVSRLQGTTPSLFLTNA